MTTRVFICSRYSGDRTHNRAVAKALCREAINRGLAPFAPHLLYPQFLKDTGDEREEGLRCGLAFLSLCDKLWVRYDDGLSEGMAREIDRARALGIPIEDAPEVEIG